MPLRINRKNLRIEGKRLYLRPVKISDANREYVRWLNDKEVNQFLESRFHKATLRNLRRYIKSISKDPASFFFAIVLTEGNKHIGNIKLGPIDWNHKVGDIGIMIGDKASWGRGYATEAITLLTNYAFIRLKIHKLTAGAYVNNKGSIRAFEKAGFCVEAQLKKQAFFYGEFIDVVLLSKIND